MRRVRMLTGFALVAVLAAVVLLARGEGEEHVAVKAELRDAAGLREGSLVRVSGAKVGAVTDLRITPRDTAEVTLEVERDAVPGAGARAAVRAFNLLGEKFVDLQVGDRARPLPGERIPLRSTSTPVELDDVLDVLDPATRDRLGLLLGETGVALGRRGADLEAILRRLPPTLGDAHELLRQLGQDTGVLERLLVEADRVSGEVARQRDDLGRLVRTGADALAAPAAGRAGLDASLRRAPGALAQLRTTLRRLDRTGTPLRPAARGLRTTAPALVSTLRALPGFATAARPALATTREVAPSLTRLGTKAAPVVRRLRDSAASLSGLAADAEPLTRALDEGGGRDLLSTMQNWALAIQTRDGVGHVFRVALMLTPDLLRDVQAYLAQPTKRRAGDRRPAAATRPGPRPAAPRLPDAVREPVQRVADGVKRPVDRVLEDVRKPLEPVVETVKPLLDLLLGP
ncbi:MlaD family protein [Conexibacter sp. SYSU D00693]|uniref:MlaD family protein n=1 Tax=Conexibacter sp. SYSU D00693 TaxID=2812560 RepID=UPI00196A624C|nr:MlaD family protein [Conexibacter sp. SYSU D00693]